MNKHTQAHIHAHTRQTHARTRARTLAQPLETALFGSHSATEFFLSLLITEEYVL